MRKLFLTFFYLGLSKKAPGTVGSFGALIVGLLIMQYLNEQTLFLLSLLLLIVGAKETNIYQQQNGVHDPKEIVIDEVAGMFLALSLSGATLIQAILSFIFFRIYDIWKPSIIGKIDKNVKSGWGVMGDDMLAGVFAGISSALLYFLYIKFLG
ncbi:MAG: phosphatidylglycerophosphatase A [Campylobacterales bacterium]|nr:phosphatidylglycerophosphatase A [Campylobacterales bacterium]